MAFRVPGRIASIAVDEGDRVGRRRSARGARCCPGGRPSAAGRSGDRTGRGQSRRLENGNRAQDISAARARADAAEAQLAEAQSDLSRREPLAEIGCDQPQPVGRNRASPTAPPKHGCARRAPAIVAATGRRTRERYRRRRAALAPRRGRPRCHRHRSRRYAADGGGRRHRGHPNDRAGSLVQQGQTVLTVSIDRPLRVRAYVGEPDLPRIRLAWR